MNNQSLNWIWFAFFWYWLILLIRIEGFGEALFIVHKTEAKEKCGSSWPSCVGSPYLGTWILVAKIWSPCFLRGSHKSNPIIPRWNCSTWNVYPSSVIQRKKHSINYISFCFMLNICPVIDNGFNFHVGSSILWSE